MISIDEKYIDMVTETIYNLINGTPIEKILLPDDMPYNEFNQMIKYFNKFIDEYNNMANYINLLSTGELGFSPPKSKLKFIQSFKNLHSNLKHLTWKTQQISAGDLNQQVDFMGDFSKAFNSMTKQLKESFQKIENQKKNILKHSKEIENLNKEMENELILAQNIQSSLINVCEIKIKDIDIGFIYYPSEYLGGDFMEIKPISDTLFGFFMSDVSGHGLASSLFTFMIKTAFNFWSLNNLSPALVLEMMNNDLITQIKNNYYFTAAYGILDISKNTFKYSSGGQTKPIVYKQKNNKAEILDINGFPLCLFDSKECGTYDEKIISIEYGDIVFIFTDGIVEAQNENKEFFGYDTLVKIIEKNNRKTVQEIINIIMSYVKKFTHITKITNDDIAIIGFKKIYD